MKHTKIKISILALALIFLFSFAAFFAVNFKPAKAAGTVTVNGTSIFTPNGEASIVADKQTIQGDDGNDKDVYYTMFALGFNEDNLSFRKHLAYHWFEGEEVESDGDEKKDPVNGKERFFNMEIGFKNTAFEKFIITFESQQFYKTEEGKTVNYIIFFPNGADGVYAVITADKDIDEPTAEAKAHPMGRDHININFTEKDGDGYEVRVGDPDEKADDGISGHFKNVGGNYAKYSSSSTTPVYPLIFSAEFPEKEEGSTEESRQTAQMVLYCLNDQKFIVTSATKNDNEDYYRGGSVVDDTPAVLCLNKDISYLKVGDEVEFDYQVIDVLRSSSSPSSQLYYYILTYEDYNSGMVEQTGYNYNNKDNYEEVTDDTLIDSDRKYYFPENDHYNNYDNLKDFKVDMALKVYVKLDDYSSNSETSFVYLDWYMDAEHKLNITSNSVTYGFIPVGSDEYGVTYNYGKDEAEWNAIVQRYADKVEEAAKNLSAGSSSYFYLPSAEELFKDDRTSYADMKISIYYYGDSQSSSANLATNNLSLNIPKQGYYTFTLYATDAAGNDMYYLDENNKKVTFSSTEIWDMYDDEELRGKLPWFSFKVGYKGADFKEVPGKQSTAYVGENYNSASFDINGVDGTYETKYRLFLFDRAAYYKDTKNTFSYEEFIKEMDKLFDGERKYFKEILQVSESDERYEEFKDYNWNSTSTSFTPQDGNAFYYIRAEITDKQYNTDPVTCSLAVVASVEAKALKGDSEWLKNNVASIILLSVAGVSLIAIVLLLVIKPKNKEDIDVQFEKEKNKKKNK